MPLGVILALIAYGVYSCGDAVIKGFGSSLSVFEIGFFTALFSLLPAIVAKPKGEHWRHTWKMRHPWLLQMRALAGLCATLLVIYGFTTTPLAEVYSIVFLTPVFITIISVVVMKEQVSLQRWVLLATTFVGVMLVVRPGFRELHLGHLAAVGAAFFASINTTVLRAISTRETKVSLIGVVVSYAVVADGILMIPTFQAPTLHEMAMLLVVGLFGGIGQLFFIAATRNAEASQVAPTQYSQIVWAIILGAVFYHEFPDHLALVGLAVVVVAGVLNVLSDETRIAAIRRFSVVVVPRRKAAAGTMPEPVEAQPAEPRPMTPAPMPEAVVMQRK